MMDICSDLNIGDNIAFTRFMACSVANEVSCRFSSGGVLFLVELPENSPLLDLSGLKRSEPEFLLPDRTIFEITGRVPSKTCLAMGCKDIIMIKLLGTYTEEDTGEIRIIDNFSEGRDEINISKFY